MAMYKCKMCGGSLEINEGELISTCEYCGSKQTIPNVKDENLQGLFNRANVLRMKSEFDKAEEIYEKIIQNDDQEAEAYWGLILCRYGVEYVEDPKTFKRIPTCHRTSYDAINADEDYKSALKYADATQRSVYEDEAKAIDEIQKGILSVSQKEDPYDVFICYKETDEYGKRTQDSVIANDIYYQLTQEGFKVFYAAISLEDKLGSEYEPYIFSALNSAKVMLSIGTRPEFFNAVWVKNEWSRYLKLMKQNRDKMLIPCYRDMDAYELPEEFAHLQAQDMSKIGFINDIVRGIKKVIQKEDEANPKVEILEATAKPTAEPLLKRAFMFLEDEEWERADDFCEQVLNLDPENAQAYLGKLMAELQIKHQEDLRDIEQPFDNSNNYQKAVRFGGNEIAEMLSGYIDHINERNETARLSELYNGAILAMNEANTESEYKAAAVTFKAISGFREADVLADRCLENAEVQRKLTEQKEEAAKRKAPAVVNALKKGIKARFGPALDERLETAKKRKVYLEHILNNIDVTQSQIHDLQSEINTLVTHEKELAEQRSRLGVFAGKEKKRIDEELETVSARKSDLVARIDQNQEMLGNYSSGEDVERELSEVNNNIINIETQIESARSNADDEYNFNEALNIYLSEPELADEVDKIYHNASILSALRGKTEMIHFGRYSQNGLQNPIEWLVLTREDSRMLVISKYAICKKEYHVCSESITWEKCSLRSWLNKDFFSAAFSVKEQAMITNTSVVNSNNAQYGTDGGRDTIDKVFLLSAHEVNEYLTADLMSEAMFSDGQSGWWWLRSPGEHSWDACVSGGGHVNDRGVNVQSEIGAVRPALWIDILNQ